MQLPDFHSLPTKTLAALFLSLALAACGGSDGQSQLDNFDDSNPGENGGSDEQPGENEPAQLGRGSADNFVAGEIEIGIGNENSLSPGGSTTLSVTAVNSDGELTTSPVDITFNSDCIASGRASLDIDENDSNSISTNNGRAEVTYTANGCVGADEVTARATFEGQSAGVARATINVEADTLQTIEYVSANPQLISLKGTGGAETSQVTFRVTGSTGAPMADVVVNFDLNTDTGGLTLVNDSAISNSDGLVSTTIQAGSIATPVVVTAIAEGTQIATQSKELRVSTGVPDQKSMSLSATEKNPNAWGYDNIPVTFTVLLADAFNNPPADGTVVSFTASGGAITESCTTEGGECEVTWRSQEPRPLSGKVVVLAHTIGNESFIDGNANGWYDDPTLETDEPKDQFVKYSADNASCERNVPPSSASESASACDDLGEAYLDTNLNNQYDSGERFIDFNKNKKRDTGDGKYNGALCMEQELNNCTSGGVTIRRDYLIVLSSDIPMLDEDRYMIGQPQSISFTGDAPQSIAVQAADQNGNPLPIGTTIEIDLSNAQNVVATSETFTVPSTTEVKEATFTLRADGDEPPSGTIEFVITAGELETRSKYTTIN